MPVYTLPIVDQSDKACQHGSMIKIHAIPAFADNYIWLIQYSDHHAAVVDPGDGQSVLAALRQRNLQLGAILLTHHHWDHVDGVATLLAATQVPVYGPSKDPINGLSHPSTEGDLIRLDGLELAVLEVPGHTQGHLAYHGHGALFCGDTLFAAGCGRLMGGTAKQLHSSLQRIAQLAPETQIYCAHEYTLANLRFAQTVEPSNIAIEQRRTTEQQKRDHGQPTIPSTLATELATNPFLRCREPAVIAAAEQFAGQTLTEECDVFRTLRFWKDSFS